MNKKINWDWLPLSMLIFIVYMIQRGLAALAKTDIVIPWLMSGLGIYFTTASLTTLIIGFISDRIKPIILIIASIIIGVCGIIGLSINQWLFGILFGIAAASFKIISYSAPLKNKTTNIDALRIAPQASAKNFGAAFFILLAGGIITNMGFYPFVLLLSTIFVIIGLWSIITLKNHNIEKSWKIKDIIELSKNYKFWLFIIYCGLMVGLYYLAVSGFIPAMLSIGLSRNISLLIFGLCLIGSGLLRWPHAWLGEKIGHWKVMVAGTIGIGVSLLLTNLYPIFALLLFMVSGSAHTPNYWTCAKKEFGAKYIGTVLGLGYVAMYLGAGILYGKW